MTEEEMNELAAAFIEGLRPEIEQIVREEVEKYFEERIPDFD
jgi:hypothetical protein